MRDPNEIAVTEHINKWLRSNGTKRSDINSVVLTQATQLLVEALDDGETLSGSEYVQGVLDLLIACTK